MKKLIIDTDIGADCDDSVALALAISLQKQGKIKLDGVTSVSAREGATQTISAIFEYFNLAVDVGRYSGKPLKCDEINVYTKAVKDKFGGAESFEDSVKLLRKKLALSSDKVTLVSIGPLTNIAELLQSKGDEISPLSGVELVEQKVDALYSMAGNFLHLLNAENKPETEWNILQDIKACQTVVKLCPVEIVFAPFEIGAKVLTGKSFKLNDPVGYSIKEFYSVLPNDFCGEYTRSSWDPITVAVASGENLFAYSNYGKITVTDSGVTNFEEGDGKHRFLIKTAPELETATKLESICSYLTK